MTREEAKRRMESCRNFLANNYPDMGEPNFTAFNMAIEALSAEPCDDAISRQAALDKAAYTETEEGWSGMTVDVKDIESLPPVTPQPKLGRWIESNDKDFYRCSECGCYWEKDEVKYCNIDFCPNCGAKMFDPQESEETE